MPLTVFRDRKVVRLMVKVGDRSKFEATEVTRRVGRRGRFGIF